VTTEDVLPFYLEPDPERPIPELGSGNEGCDNGLDLDRLLVLVGVVLIPTGVLTCHDNSQAQVILLMIAGIVMTRKTYSLSVRVDPKINAFLVLEKARTGRPMAEIVEEVFREYIRTRDRGRVL
jgi:hypothetical protein